MHLIVPFAAPFAGPSAAPLPEDGRAALRSLALPRLRRLVARSATPQRDDGDAWSFTPPHERALARAFGWAGGDGALPFAAWHAAADGLPPDDLAWGEVTPVHWHLGTDQVSLLDPAALHLDEAESREFLGAVQDLFTSEGFAVAWGAPQRWYVAHESLATLRTASLDRVIGRNVDRWLTDDPAVRLVRRLQNEVQMLLYTHPLNAAREARGLLPVNSFWLSGCGVWQAPAGAPPRVDDRLRASALAGDWAAWVKAWDTLDAGPLAELAATAARGLPWRLTLCGERSAVDFGPAPGAWARWSRRWVTLLPTPAPAALLETL